MQRQPRPSRVLAYVRVSSQAQGQHGTSLDGQQDQVRAWCAREGFPEPEVFVEIESGSYERREQRTQQLRLMATVSAGDLVIVAKQDRWSRDTLHYLESTRAIVARGARFYSLGEGFDPSTPEGAFAATMMAAVAQQERERIKQRTVGRRRELRDQGFSVEGHAPFGYERVARRLVPYEPEARLVRLAFELCAGGRSIRQVCARFAAEGTPRQKWAVHGMLRRRLYLGERIDSSGVPHQSHEPLVDRSVFERAQAALVERRHYGRRSVETSATSSWLLRGLAVCARCGRRCGARYSPRTKVDPLDSWYGCNARLRASEGLACAAEHSKVGPTDARASALTLERLVALRVELARPASVGPLEAGPDVTAALRKLADRRRRIVDLAESGALTSDEARSRLARIEAEAHAVEEQARAHEARRVAAEALRSRAGRRERLSDVDVLSRAWGRMRTPEKRIAVEILASRIELDGGIVAMSWRPLVELAGGNEVSGESCQPGRLLQLVRAVRGRVA